MYVPNIVDLIDLIIWLRQWKRMLGSAATMNLTHVTARALELTANSRDGRVDGSLLELLGTYVKTPPGRRLLKRWLTQPSTRLDTVNGRHDAVKALVECKEARELAAEKLRNFPDVERIFVAADRGKVHLQSLNSSSFKV
jgi:DNA mismatch repair ATPase MutS